MALTFRVRIALTTDPFSGSPSWTDISSFVAIEESTIDITRGSEDRDTQISPSTISLTVNNKDGRFTPGYTGGAYYPDMVIGKRIHIDASLNGSTYSDRFDGYIDTLPATWGVAALTALPNPTGSDRLKKLARQLMANNLVATYILADGPTDYWDFSDAEGTVVPHNQTGVTPLTSYGSGGTITYGDTNGPPYDGLTGLLISNQSLRARTFPRYTFSETQSLTICGFVRCIKTDINNSIFALYDIWDAISSSEMAILLGDGTSYAGGFIVNSAGSSIEPVGTVNVMDGDLHFIAMVLQGNGVGLGGSLTNYVDGIVDSTSSVSSAFLAGGITAPLNFVAEDATGVGSYSCTHFAIFQSALTAQNVSDIASAGLSAFTGETSAQRFTRIAGFAGITPTVTGTSGTQDMGPLSDVKGVSIFDLLQQVQDTENGAFYVGVDGSVILVPRTAFYNIASAMTFAAGQYGTDLAFLADDSAVINDATATGSSGIPQEATNATSITANGTYSVQQDLDVQFDNEAMSWATWQVNTSSTAARVLQVTIDVLPQLSLLPALWGIDIGDSITLANLPTGAPASSVQLIVAGYAESYSLDSYTITFNTVLTAPGVYTIGDATWGTLNGPGVIAY